MQPQYITIDEWGSKYYYRDKKMTVPHREDGPAVEYANGAKSWYLGDYGRLSEKEHAKLTKKVPTININGKEFTVDELNSLIEIFKGK